MRIGLLLDPYGEKTPGGLGRFVFEFARELVESSPDDTFTVFTKESERPSFLRAQDAHVVLGASPIWKRLGSSFDEELDCHVFFTPIIPLFFKPKRLIVFALDFAYLDLPGKGMRAGVSRFMLKRLHANVFRRADRVVAISGATRDSLLHYVPAVDAKKVSVIHPGYVVQNTRMEPLPISDRYFLFSGVFKERKNVMRILEAFARVAADLPEHHLVLSGKKSGAYYEKLQSFVQRSGLASRIHFVGYVSNEQLAYLLAHAEALVFASLVEGFGMPVLEAMNAGTPVITSSTGALAEVAGNAALLVDPLEVSAIASAMKTIATDVSLRDSLVVKGRERVKAFSWEKSATALKQLIGEEVK